MTYELSKAIHDCRAADTAWVEHVRSRKGGPIGQQLLNHVHVHKLTGTRPDIYQDSEGEG